MQQPHLPQHPATRRRAGQAGFTLVELVAVIIILGILAAVLTPRYINFVDQTRTASYQSVASEGLSRFSGAYQKYLVDTQIKPSTLTDLSGAAYLNLDGSGRTNIGDYDVLYTLGGTTLTVQVYSSGGATALASTSISWP